MNKPTQFHIELDGLNLSDHQVNAIAADLDKVVSTHLAKINLGGDHLNAARPIWLNPGWRGIWILKQKVGSLATVSSAAELPGVLKALPQDPVPLHR